MRYDGDDDEPCGTCGHDVVDHQWMYPEWSMCHDNACDCAEYVPIESLRANGVGRRVRSPLVHPPATPA